MASALPPLTQHLGRLQRRPQRRAISAPICKMGHKSAYLSDSGWLVVTFRIGILDIALAELLSAVTSSLITCCRTGNTTGS